MSDWQALPGREGSAQWFVIVVAVFLVCLSTASATAEKLLGVFGATPSAGVLILPVSYVVDSGVLVGVCGGRGFISLPFGSGGRANGLW